jgi:hypothetical protein
MRELAEHELRLACEDRLEDLCGLAVRWEELTSGLPAHPPEYARASLVGAAELQARTRAVLLTRREQLLSEMRKTARAGRAGRGYARIRRRAASRFDRSA